MRENTKITVVGSGYVGMSLAILLAQHNDVVILDVDSSKVEKINQKKSTIKDSDIDAFLINKNLSIYATLDKKKAYQDSDFIIVATPTDYRLEEEFVFTAYNQFPENVNVTQRQIKTNKILKKYWNE